MSVLAETTRMQEAVLNAKATLAGRQAVMAVCAESQAGELATALASLPPIDGARDLRPASVGLVMMRGRMGGDGRAFNLGEATVTRATIALPDGRIGFAYHLGRDVGKARTAATLDALWQGDARDAVEASLAAIRSRIEAEHARAADRSAATRVEFFTLKRGED